MEELITMLNSIDDAYFDFVSAMIHYAEKKQSRQERLIAFLKNHPYALTADVIRFVSEQNDFFEDAAYMEAV